MVTSISINSHLPHVPLTGCRFLPFNFIAARQLRRASSLMRFCTVVGSHNSCNFLWYLRYQITRCIRPADLVLGFRTYRWFTKGFQHPWHLDYRLNSSLLRSILVFSSAYRLSWAFLVRRVLTREIELHLIWNPWEISLPGVLKFLCLPRDWSVIRYIFDSFLFLIYQGFDISQLSAVGSGASGA